MLLYFKPSITHEDWPLIVDSLKIIHPNLKWAGNEMLGLKPKDIDSLNPFEPRMKSSYIDPKNPIDGLIIDEESNSLYSGRFGSKQSMLRISDPSEKIVNGWKYLGIDEKDFYTVLDALSESKLIRKIIKESLTNEFDWVDTSFDDDDPAELYKMIDSFLKASNSRYWVEFDDSHLTYEIWDSTGTYVVLEPDNFTIPVIRDELKKVIFSSYNSPKLRDEYEDLYLTLEPILGPLNKS
jgi:hypothetical protein